MNAADNDPSAPNGYSTKKIIPRILVVDDEELIRGVLGAIIRKKTTYEVEFAVNGQEALEKYKDAYSPIDQASSRPFDVLIIDLKMPVMDGERLIHEIRKLDSFTQLIVLTAHGTFSDAQSLLENYQIFDFIQKPFRKPEQIVFSLENALEKKRLALEKHKRELELLVSNESLRTEIKTLQGSSEQLTSNIRLIHSLVEFATFAADTIYVKGGNSSPYCFLLLDKKLDNMASFRIGLKALETYYPDDLLLRVHHSYLINPSKVVTFKKPVQSRGVRDIEILLATGEGLEIKVPISRRYHQKLREFSPQWFVKPHIY